MVERLVHDRHVLIRSIEFLDELPIYSGSKINLIALQFMEWCVAKGVCISCQMCDVQVCTPFPRQTISICCHDGRAIFVRQVES